MTKAAQLSTASHLGEESCHTPPTAASGQNPACIVTSPIVFANATRWRQAGKLERGSCHAGPLFQLRGVAMALSLARDSCRIPSALLCATFHYSAASERCTGPIGQQEL